LELGIKLANQFQVFIIQVLIFTFSLLASSLSLLSPAPFVLLVLFVFVNDETFSNLNCELSQRTNIATSMRLES
jgi:hypothetical protein